MSNMTQKQRSLKNGEKIEVGDTIYVGRPPRFQMINGQFLKVAKGIPFVNAGKA